MHGVAHLQDSARRRPYWRTLLLLVTLFSLVGLYYQHVTHYQHSPKYTQLYPKCQVEKPTILGTLAPDPSLLLAFNVAYFALSTRVDKLPVHIPPTLRPPSRAPPAPSAKS